MNRYLLSTYRVSGEVPGAPAPEEEMNDFMTRVIALEENMEAEGVFVFGGALRDPDSASVVNTGDMLTTDGPFAEAKEHIAGFYIINAADDEAARTWARRVAKATNRPIEVWPFAATGRVKDMAGDTP
jgi:hypothetical protein